jgi:hypothetical protein
VEVRWVWAFVDVPEEGAGRGVEFWTRVTHTRPSPWRGDRGQFATLLPQSGDAWVKVQRVGGGGGVHLDLDVDVPLDEARDRAVDLGAAVLAEVADDGEPAVVVCRTPGGLVFCLTRWHPEETARGVARHGAESLLDQVCLDIPQQRYAAEVAFWSRLTGWPVDDEGSDEFERLRPPDQAPLRFLLQRLGEETGRVRAHLDLACVDREAEVARHAALGATRVRTGRGWVVMRDPNGMEYCCTGRHPATSGAPPA